MARALRGRGVLEAAYPPPPPPERRQIAVDAEQARKPVEPDHAFTSPPEAAEEMARAAQARRDEEIAIAALLGLGDE